MLTEYNKVTTGFVIQTFKKRGKKFVCTYQDFQAADQCDYENCDGESLSEEQRTEANIGTSRETYQPFDMEQPSKHYYFLQMWGLVEPQVYGPYESGSARTLAMNKIKAEEGEEKHTYHTFELPKGVEINL